MINPLQVSLTKADGTKRSIIIEPILEKADSQLRNTGTYKIFKDAFSDKSVLFTEPLETDEPNNDLPDDMNPDYLGKIVVDPPYDWKYEGDLLTLDEQKQAAACILKY